MSDSILFSPFTLGTITLKNRLVMAPMTRSRAVQDNAPAELEAKYYGQRAGAGLIITEGTSPSPNGLGYARIPGIYNNTQKEGWEKVAEAVHAKGSKLFIQLMHTGRVSAHHNLPQGGIILAPSAVKASGQMWTDTAGMQDHATPKAMSKEELDSTKEEFVHAAQLAIEAGADGIELHSANGYLLEQFLSPFSNIRTDEYGGSIKNRCRFVLEVAQAVADTIGKDKVGIRVSPYGNFNDMPAYDSIDATYKYLTEALSNIGLAYIHIVDHSSMGAPVVSADLKAFIRTNFKGAYILSGGYTQEKAENDLKDNKGDLVAFGKPFINNPDLDVRFRDALPLNADLKFDLLYTPGENGYTDYPNA